MLTRRRAYTRAPGSTSRDGYEGPRVQGQAEGPELEREQQDGRYWYYRLVIVGGAIFVITALATDMFGLGGE